MPETFGKGFARTLEALRAAGEPTRLRLLHLLGHEELSVMELVEILGQSQPRISRHLRLMGAAGLIERFPEGAFVFYRVSPQAGFAGLIREVLGLIDGQIEPDLRALAKVRLRRAAAAEAYFEALAPSWDELRARHVSEARVEDEILRMTAGHRFRQMVDLGTGSGRMLTLIGSGCGRALGLDLSQNMLNIARKRVAEAGLSQVDLRHGDILATRLEGGSADLVVIHQVLHFLHQPKLALMEAGRILAPDGQVLIIDFSPHTHTDMADSFKHLKLGISASDMSEWTVEAGLAIAEAIRLPPSHADGLEVSLWRLIPAASLNARDKA